MNGNYQENMVSCLRRAGIKNVVLGNYSAWFKGFDKKLNPLVDTLGDASAIIFYNQDENDPIALHLVNTSQCKLEGEIRALGLVVHRYSGKNSKEQPCERYVIRYELRAPRPGDFSLRNLGIQQTPPTRGQFNLIGYSWGSVIAARSAIFYARTGVNIDNLVLIGAPINDSLLKAVKYNSHIKNLIVMNLGQLGDPVYAGISDIDLAMAALRLAVQMDAGRGDGHFYYALEGEEGARRDFYWRSIWSKKVCNDGQVAARTYRHRGDRMCDSLSFKSLALGANQQHRLHGVGVLICIPNDNFNSGAAVNSCGERHHPLHQKSPDQHHCMDGF